MNRHITIVVAISLGACGGMAQKQSSPRSAAQPASYETSAAGVMAADLQSPDGRREEISRRFQEITDWRRQSGLYAEPGQSAVAEVAPMSVDSVRSTTTATAPRRSLTCVEVCRIQEAICDNAESICQLADELPGDEWAEEKCNSGKASCQEASEKCTECTPKAELPSSDDSAAKDAEIDQGR